MYIQSAPPSFPVHSTFTIEEGESLHHVSVQLQEEHYIRSSLWFRAWVSTLGRDRSVHLGGYTFTTALTLGDVVRKLTSGNPDVPLVSLTIPEGSTSFEIATLVHKVLPSISVESFLENVAVTHSNGRLFPSTYFLFPSDTADRLITLMTKTFDSKYETEFGEMLYPSPLVNEDQVISLAAIIEGEAKTKEDMQLVSGILLHRLTLGLRLQVDVASSTYTQAGLPQIPINNPGSIALYAAFHPTKSTYLYYLTGKDGTMHYATTFEEHKQNIQKYLR